MSPYDDNWNGEPAEVAGPLILHGVIARAADEIGFTASVFELDLETCGETQAEMAIRLQDLVRGYFRAERRRGTLSTESRAIQLLVDDRADAIAESFTVSLVV